MTIAPTGEYRVDNGTYNYRFRCDGKDYPISSKRTMSCSQTKTTINTTSKENHKKVASARWELSSDERTLTVDTTSFVSGDPPKLRQNVYSRTSSSTGFAGDWLNTERLKSRPRLLLLLRERTLHLKFYDQEKFIDLPLDGTEAPVQGPGTPDGVTMSVRPNGPREFFTLKKFEGHIVNQGVLRLSSDGRSLVEEYWKPERPDEKAVLVYERQ